MVCRRIYSRHLAPLPNELLPLACVELHKSLFFLGGGGGYSFLGLPNAPFLGFLSTLHPIHAVRTIEGKWNLHPLSRVLLPKPNTHPTPPKHGTFPLFTFLRVVEGWLQVAGSWPPSTLGIPFSSRVGYTTFPCMMAVSFHYEQGPRFQHMPNGFEAKPGKSN